MSIPGWLILDLYVMLIAGMLLVFVLRKKQKTRQDHTFFVLLVTVLILLAGDLMSRCNPNGTPGTLYVLSRIGNYIIFAGDPAGYLMTLRYINSWIDDSENRPGRKAGWILYAYAAVNFAAVTISEIGRFGWFYFFPDRVYQRGPLYIPRGIMNMFFCLFICFYIMHRRKEIRTEYTGCVIAFPLIVLISGILQVFVGGAAYEYAGTIFACLLLYIVVQNRSMDMDYLTGLLNRRGIDDELQYRLQHSSTQQFSTYLLDLDFFKNINDDCGHESGDDALRAMAALLRKAFGRSAVIGRFGGDEFLVINGASNLVEAEQYINNLEKLCSSYNRDGKGRRGYRLGFSAGYDVYSAEKYPTLDAYIAGLDKMMYSEKNRHHAIRN